MAENIINQPFCLEAINSVRSKSSMTGFARIMSEPHSVNSIKSVDGKMRKL